MQTVKFILAIGLLAIGTGLSAQNGASNIKNGMAFSTPDRTFPGEKAMAERHTGHNRNAQSINSFIAKDDSIYFWAYDTNTFNWSNNVAYEKQINMVYDSHQNVTSITYQMWNGTNWVNYQLLTLSYDANNNETGVLEQDWNGSGFVNYELDTKSYDSHNNNTGFIDASWNGTSWVNNFQFIDQYDASNNDTNHVQQNWTGSAWVNADMFSDKFNANNGLTSGIYFYWSSGWVYDDLTIDSYDVNMNKTSELNQKWISSSWVNQTLDMYTCDANHNKLSDTNETWSGSAWQNALLNTYTYDANNNNTSDLHQAWSGIWVNSQLQTFTFDASNNETKDLQQNWIGTWVNSSVYVNTYDVNELRLSQTGRIYNSSGTKVTSGDSVYWYFHDVLGEHTISAKNAGIKAYPNPSDGKFTFQWTAISSGSVVEIYNTNGQQIRSLELTGSTNQIDLSHETGGVYFYRVIANSGNLIGEGKLVIQK